MEMRRGKRIREYGVIAPAGAAADKVNAFFQEHFNPGHANSLDNCLNSTGLIRDGVSHCWAADWFTDDQVDLLEGQRSEWEKDSVVLQELPPDKGVLDLARESGLVSHAENESL